MSRENGPPIVQQIGRLRRKASKQVPEGRDALYVAWESRGEQGPDG
jgi:hypothetical protein